MTTAETMFALIGYAMGKTASAPAVAAEEIQALYDLSVFHDMAHLVCSGLDRAGLMPEGEAYAPLVKAFRKQKKLAVFRAENIAYEYGRLRKVLGDAGIDYMPLKGSILRGYYPEGWMRTSCDIDLLVHYRNLVRYKKLQIEFKWVPSHGGHPWNEVCDNLCAEALYGIS